MIAVARKPFRTLVSLSLALGVLMGGTLLGAVAEQSATLPPISGTWDSSLGNSFQKIGAINSLTLDANNNLYVAGDFNYLNQSEVNGLARWDGSVWQGYGLHPTDSGKIRKVLSFDNSLFAIGTFNSLQQARNHIARWDGTSFQAIGNGFTGHLTQYPTETYVSTLTSFDNTLFIGGDFTHFDGRPAYGIGQWNSTVVSQTADFEWMVNSFASNGSDLIAGGNFTQIDGIPSRLARLVNHQWQPFDVTNLASPNLSFNVYAVQNTIYLAGHSGSTDKSQLYRLDGTTAITLGNQLNYSIDNLIGIGSDLYIQSNQQLLKLNNNQWETPNLPFTINRLTALTANASTLYLGGDFQVNGTSSQIVAWNGAQAQSLATLFVIDDQGLVSGDAGRPIIINGKLLDGPDASIRRWNGNSWQTLAATSDYTWGGLKFHRVNNQLFSFFLEPQALVAGQPASNVWRLDGTTWTRIGLDLPSMTFWYPSGQQMLTYVAQPQTTLPITGIYAFDGITLQHQLQPAWFDSFSEVFFFANNFYAINVINDQWSDFIEIRRWNGQTWQVLKFLELPKADFQFLLWNQRLFMASSTGKLYEIAVDGNLNELASADGSIYAMAGRDDGSLYLGGDFSTIDAAATGPIASFDGTNFRGLVSQPNGRVSSLSVDRNHVYVAGDFTKVGTVPSLGVAVFTPTKQVYLPAAMR